MNKPDDKVRRNLKPCPFCGELPMVYPHPEDVASYHMGNAFGSVECANDDCPAQPCVQDGEDSADDRGSELYKQAAIQRWNKRAKL